MAQPHFKHKAPKLELMSLDKAYSFTFSPEDIRDQTTYKANDLHIEQNYRDLYREIETILKNLKSTCYIELYPELSPTGRLHFHGCIQPKDLFKFYFQTLYKLQKKGVYEIDTIADMEKWKVYCQKQKDIMEKVHDSQNIDYPLRTHKNYKFF